MKVNAKYKKRNKVVDNNSMRSIMAFYSVRLWDVIIYQPKGKKKIRSSTMEQNPY